ncbi:MAG TPA: glycerol-3-phosphate dehydrogenase subunit GlpB [Anaerolineae bacterium]|nr:glycerol-3-phosphate dehydrogenase subunit GlpB [Anaerolineae bacterium]
MHYDTIVIGAGMSGLMAAGELAVAGQRVLLLAAGAGALPLASACIDVLGFDGEHWVRSPEEALPDFLERYPNHPYARLGLGRLRDALRAFLSSPVGQQLGYQGSLEDNFWLPTAIGAARPTCLVPATMQAGDLRDPRPMLLAGFPSLKDFYPHLAAANLVTHQASGLALPSARAVMLDLPALRDEVDLTPLQLARLFEDAQFQVQVVEAVYRELRPGERVGFPAVLGLNQSLAVWRQLQEMLEAPVFEIPTLPPSVPGLRLFQGYEAWLRSLGVRMIIGSPIQGSEVHNSQARSVEVEAAIRTVRYRADHFVLATGGIYGHGLDTNAEGQVWETVFNLPLHAAQGRGNWFNPDRYASQPVHSFGVVVNDALQPVDDEGRVVLRNVRVVGASLANWDGPGEKSGDGVTVGTGYAAAEAILSETHGREEP